MTHSSTLTKSPHPRGKSKPARFTNHKISTEKQEGKHKPFFPKDIRPGTLIVVEGQDGSGKSTQVRILQKLLESNGFFVHFTEWNSNLKVKPLTKALKKMDLKLPATVFDPCATKTVGQACDGTTALYAGTYGGYKYMTTPSDQPSSTWGPNGETGITGKTDGAANTAALLAL